MKSIIFIGFRGAGKTTLAQKIVKKSTLKLFDTDLEFEKKFNSIIPDFSQQCGIANFRKLEHELIKKSLNKTSNHLIVLGGGFVDFQANNKILQNSNLPIFFIDTDVSIIQNRLRNDKSRIPITDNANDLKKLFLQRRKKYLTICDYILRIPNC